MNIHNNSQAHPFIGLHRAKQKNTLARSHLFILSCAWLCYDTFNWAALCGFHALIMLFEFIHEAMVYCYLLIVRETTGKLSDSTSVLTLTPTMYDDGKTWECQATNQALEIPRRATITVDVQCKLHVGPCLH